ncbi:MAG: hypothetical protein ACRD8O_07570 [Bryobacteraceae bacterium]
MRVGAREVRKRLAQYYVTAEGVAARVRIDLPPGQYAPELNGSDLVPVFNQYAGFGDMVTATEVAAMLGRKAKTVRVRMASGAQFADLRQAPALLIGAITNRWTMELGQNWRFRFNRTPELKSMIVDTGDAGGRQWSVPPRADGLAPEDYILISRIRNSTTGNLLMVAAGLKQFGTEAAVCSRILRSWA